MDILAFFKKMPSISHDSALYQYKHCSYEGCLKKEHAHTEEWGAAWMKKQYVRQRPVLFYTL